MDKDFLEVNSFTGEEIISLLDLADTIKKHPVKYKDAMTQKTLLMIFEKPSLRTRVSFETGMTQMGGHAIYYDMATSPMGKKESVADTAKTASRYVDIIMARLFEHKNIVELAQNASVPVINALTDFSHPCQILADLQTIREKKGRLKGLKLLYSGDCNNNVTHSLMFGCALVGIDIAVSCPDSAEYKPSPEVVQKAAKIAEASGSKVEVFHDANKAAEGADIVYTDSWMSYHIAADQKERRIRELMPFQVNAKLMACAKKDAVFMNCLPAMRGMEQTAEVIDGKQSIVFDQAENRLHTQKALVLMLLRIL